VSKKELLADIEKKREELIAIATKTGFTSSLSLQYSMELDTLLNQYERLYCIHDHKGQGSFAAQA